MRMVPKVSSHGRMPCDVVQPSYVASVHACRASETGLTQNPHLQFSIPLHEAPLFTEVSRELCQGFCSLLFPVSKMCANEIPSHGSPERV
jgi:hypothetical protein